MWLNMAHLVEPSSLNLAGVLGVIAVESPHVLYVGLFIVLAAVESIVFVHRRGLESAFYA